MMRLFPVRSLRAMTSVASSIAAPSTFSGSHASEVPVTSPWRPTASAYRQRIAAALPSPNDQRRPTSAALASALAIVDDAHTQGVRFNMATCEQLLLAVGSMQLEEAINEVPSPFSSRCFSLFYPCI